MSLKCKACNTSIYPNDPQISLDGAGYHKSCAKCADCKCQISLSNFTKSGDVLLCKTHYFKRFHEEGSYLGGDKYSRASSQDGGSKTAAEPVNASTPAASSSGSTEIATPVNAQSLKAKFEKPAVGSAASGEPGKAKKVPVFGSVNPKCAVCTKSIYPNDPQIALDGVKYHTECAKCEDCKCKISLANFTKSGTTLLCKTHYFTRFSVSGSYLGGDKFEKKSDRDTRGPSPSTQLFKDETPNETSGPASRVLPPTPVDIAVEPPAAPEKEQPPAPVVEEPKHAEEVAPIAEPVVEPVAEPAAETTETTVESAPVEAAVTEDVAPEEVVATKTAPVEAAVTEDIAPEEVAATKTDDSEEASV